MSIFEQTRQRERCSPVPTADGFLRSSIRPVKSTGRGARAVAPSSGGPYVRGMRNFAIWILLSSSVATWCGCHGDDESAEQPAVTARKARPQGVPQVAPPLDLKAPPADATKTASGLIYKRLNANSAGAQARIDETVLVRYTGWRQHTGETFFTTGSGQPIAIDLAHAAPGFREALPLLHK